MFGIPELDEMICRQLRPHDLAQCVRVNKKWHKATIPYLWGDLACLQNCFTSNRSAFYRMVLKDYLYEQRRQQLQESDYEMEQHAQGRSLPFMSSLAKYGPWIRKLPEPRELMACLQPPYRPTRRRTPSRQALTGQSKEPTACELFHHFLKHCSGIQEQSLRLTTEDINSNDFLRTITELWLPHARHLHILSFNFDPFLESWKLKYLLNRCSNTLKELTLDIEISYAEDEKDDTDEWQEENEPKSRRWLKELVLTRCIDKSDAKAFWPWLWMQCGHVERLEVGMLHGISQSLVEGMLTFMPNLREITAGQDHMKASGLTNNDVAAPLSGWSVVETKHNMSILKVSKRILVRHFVTLKALEVSGVYFTSDDLVRVLSSCPNLHTLSTIDAKHYREIMCPRFRADIFIDQVPDTVLLKTWACESSLKVLKIRIAGIPRPDLEEDGDIIDDVCPGQGLEIQSLVYDRLSRFTNLETLWLGHKQRSVYGRSKGYQGSCLEMSLASGLQKLAGLKALRELNVLRMKTRIGLKEVQWMTENWPVLCNIYGLDEKGNDKEVVKWLQEHHPEIDLPDNK
ncbi:hypothetical protein BGZ65_006476 [Modicella reniformis]|uniref:F-box domain-containing protein n=1 Tax=Modicella reniformis TaxID=1440133 RepID=A0A9P6LT47_9FUNG|nr:hypothetical protein BGZ65_006476 [Modicella reniformis]